MRIGVLEVCSRGKKLSTGDEFVFGGQRFYDNFHFNFGEDYMKSTQCNANFGHQLGICPRTEETCGKP
jgi:hypothetical protein